MAMMTRNTLLHGDPRPVDSGDTPKTRPMSVLVGGRVRFVCSAMWSMKKPPPKTRDVVAAAEAYQAVLALRSNRESDNRNATCRHGRGALWRIPGVTRWSESIRRGRNADDNGESPFPQINAPGVDRTGPVLRPARTG
jgi:hypothetical protein